jgi:hypothetical protein
MRTALAIVILFLACGAMTANANWYQVSSGTDQDLHAIGSDYSLRLVVGNNGTILYSPDNGSTWHPLQSPVGVDLRTIRRTNWNAYHCWFVGGTAGQVWGLRVNDVQYDVPLPWENLSVPTSATVNCLFGDASNYLFAACEDGTVWEKYLYNPWVQRSVPTSTPALNSAQGGWSAGGATIVVGDNGTILRRVAHGDPFERVESGVTVDLYDVAGGYGQPFFVIGDQGTILKSTDAGLTWTPMSACTEQCLYYWTGYGLAWRVGGACGAYLLRDDPWCPAPLPTSADMFAASSVGYYGEIVVGAGGLIFKIADDRAACTCYPIGACCLDNGVCERLTADRCTFFGGVWHGEGVACDPDLCDPPVCVVDPMTLDFGAVTIGEAVDLTFTVTNGGGGTLEGSVGTAMAPYSVVSGGGTYSLGASESVTVTVRFTPTTEGPSTSTVTTGGDPVTCAGVGEVPPPGSIVGTVRVGGTTLEGATIDLLDSSEALLEVMLTDATGHYEFVDRETNPYTVELVLPLGYQPADGTQLSVDVDLPPGETLTVNFDLESITQTAEARSAGYWKHQYKVHESGHGSAQESLDDLLTYQQLIFDHFYSRQDQYAIRIPGVTCGGEDVLSVDVALETLSIRGGSMSGLAHRQLLALLLNVVSGKVSTSHVASECGATVSQVITHVAQLLTDTDPDNDERAKNLAEQVNLSQLMPTDAELGEVPDITYRRSVASLESSLLFVRPNPAVGYASIFYAVPPQGADVALRVFNSSGRLVRTLVDEHASGGLHRVTWQADNDAGQPVAAGVYFSRIHVDGKAETRKIILR